jgi:hypothetical protein
MRLAITSVADRSAAEQLGCLDSIEGIHPVRPGIVARECIVGS